eukprot:1049730-Pyramimonas_sp.AAC.1
MSRGKWNRIPSLQDWDGSSRALSPSATHYAGALGDWDGSYRALSPSAIHYAGALGDWDGSNRALLPSATHYAGALGDWDGAKADYLAAAKDPAMEEVARANYALALFQVLYFRSCRSLLHFRSLCLGESAHTSLGAAGLAAALRGIAQSSPCGPSDRCDASDDHKSGRFQVVFQT